MKKIFKKIRFSLHLFAAFCQKRKNLILISFFLGILTFVFLPRISPLLLRKKAVRIGVVGRFTAEELPLEVQQLISDGLTAIADDGQPEPKLAESWQVNREGREYLFKLKENISWQDNKPVLAEDIDYHFSDVAATVVDKQQIKFELKEPFSPFPSVVARPIFKKGLLGTGEYRVTKIKKNGQVIERLSLSSQDKNKENLIFRFYPTEKAARTAFKLGEVDALRGISHAEEFANWPKVKIEPVVKNNRFVAVFFNTQEESLADKSTRQALAYAIKKPWQSRALSPINPQSWAYNPSVKPYDFNLKKAQNLLEADLKEVELTTIPSLLDTAEAIKKDWEELGITAKIKVINNLSNDFQVLLAAQEIPSDPDQYVLWHSTQEANISRHKSPKIDKLLEDGRKTFNQAERKSIYRDFQKFLAEDTPAIFLFHPTLYNVTRI